MIQEAPPARRSLRILQAAHFFLPRHRGGVELYTSHLCGSLAQRHAVHLFYAERNLHLPSYSARTGRHGEIDCTEVTNNLDAESFEQTYDNPSIDAAFETVVERFRPDVAHFQHLMNLSIGMLGVLESRGIPVLMTLHDYWAMCPAGGWRFRDGTTVCEAVDSEVCGPCFQRSAFNPSRLERTVFRLARQMGPGPALALYRVLRTVQLRAPGPVRRAESATRGAPAVLAPLMKNRLDRLRDALSKMDLLLSPSEFVRRAYVEFGVPGERIRVLANGIQHATPGPVTPSARFRVGFLGTVAPAKGVHVLVDACRRLPEGVFEIRVVGDMTIWPGYVGDLRRSARDLPIAFADAVEHASIGDLLAGLDALVVPSIWRENAPQVVQEALMAGVPVVASDIGGLPEMVRHGVTGFLFRPGDPADLAEKLVRLRESPGLVAALRREPPPVKTIDENARELEEIYRSLIERRRAAQQP